MPARPGELGTERNEEKREELLRSAAVGYKMDPP